MDPQLVTGRRRRVSTVDFSAGWVSPQVTNVRLRPSHSRHPRHIRTGAKDPARAHRAPRRPGVHRLLPDLRAIGTHSAPVCRVRIFSAPGPASHRNPSVTPAALAGDSESGTARPDGDHIEGGGRPPTYRPSLDHPESVARIRGGAVYLTAEQFAQEALAAIAEGDLTVVPHTDAPCGCCCDCGRARPCEAVADIRRRQNHYRVRLDRLGAALGSHMQRRPATVDTSVAQRTPMSPGPHDG